VKVLLDANILFATMKLGSEAEVASWVVEWDEAMPGKRA
jgi:hypothetical protein